MHTCYTFEQMHTKFISKELGGGIMMSRGELLTVVSNDVLSTIFYDFLSAGGIHPSCLYVLLDRKAMWNPLATNKSP